MYPPVEYNSYSYPGLAFADKPPMNQMVNPNCVDHLHTIQGSNAPLLPNTPSSIHVNPLLHGPRNIYVNKALYYNNPVMDKNQQNLVQNNRERIHYNPKFFKNSNNVLESHPSTCQMIFNKDFTKKQETSIYVNPHFIKKGNSTVVAPSMSCKSAEKKAHHSSPISSILKKTGSGIHFNPKFLQEPAATLINNVITTSPKQSCTDEKECDTNVPQQSSSQQKYISKYKIITKGKTNHPFMNNISNNGKENVKKLNVSHGRKYKYKSNREKSMSGYNCVTKYYIRKYLNYKSHFNSNKTLNKCAVDTQKPVSKLKEISSFEAKMFRLNQKKSILQQKIEARRKGKSSIAIYEPRNYLTKSKYKYRKTPASPKFDISTPKTHYSKHHFYKAETKVIDNPVTCDKSEFKTISKTKLVRKSILQTQIESRHHTKKSLLYLQRILKQIEIPVSKYKIVNSSFSSKKNVLLNKRLATSKKNPMIFSSNNYRTDKQKRIHTFTKKLRINNQPCSFYNRYGRCKRKEKGSCPKVHDSKYISICKKFLKGECKEEGCTLSHDIRPEKMPTCYHYLAGLCKRTNCPFLHIKVNQNAPICRAFLQGFCADVYNCNKRHEFICPVFAEKGHCIKGKSCSLPHRTHITISKLLEPDQFPLLNMKKTQSKFHQSKEVSKNETNLAFKEVVKENEKSSEKVKVNSKKTKVNEFQRYFLATLSVNDSMENDDEIIDNISMDDKLD